MSAELAAAVGAILSAAASAFGARLAVRMMRRACDERMQAFRDGLRERR